MSYNPFTKSETCKDEYAVSIVKVGKVHDISGADRIGQVYLDGNSLVVNKFSVKEGDCYFYIPIEVVLDEKFLYENNMFNIYHFGENSNAAEIKAVLDEADLLDGDAREAKLAEARSMCGLFSKNRTSIAKIRKVPSYGLIVGPDAMIKYKPELEEFFKNNKLEDYVGTIFDTVDGTLFCKAYVPRIKRKKNNKPRRKSKVEIRVEKYFSWLPEKYQKKLIKKFDKRKGKKKFGEGINFFIPGKLQKHYDTEQLGQNIWKFDYKKDIVDISLKIHGTSLILGHVLRGYPRTDLTEKEIKRNKWVKKLHLPKTLLVPETYDDYGYIYSTRNVIQNKDMNPTAKVYENQDVYGPYLKIFEENHLLDKGMTVYGEIFGYFNNSGKCVQSKYDYGCEKGDNKLMIYRITSEDEKGNKIEWNISDVIEWTNNMLEKHPEFKDKIIPLIHFYHGTFVDRYPDIDEKNWREDLILKLKNDPEWNMESDEPMCKHNKVPREGIVIRKENDPKAEAFKLKSDAFFLYQKSKTDKGEVDIEMMSEYSDDDSESEENIAE